MVSHISSYTTNTNLFNQAQRLQANYAKAAQQSASGLRAENFNGISSDAQRLLVLNGDYSNLTAQAAGMKAAQLRVGAMQNAVDSITDTLNKVATFFVDVQSGINTAAATPGFVAQATTLRDSIVGLLNSQVGGAYLFGGSAYDRAPVNITDPGYTPGAAPTVPNTSYYQGDASIDSIRVSDTQRVDYGITAGHPGFEMALRALELYIGDPSTAATVTQATDLNKSAINEVTELRGQLLSRLNIITDAASNNTVTASYLQDNIASVRDVDIAAAATQMSQYETQLQASYSAFSKLLQLRLTDYLR